MCPGGAAARARRSRPKSVSIFAHERAKKIRNKAVVNTWALTRETRAENGELLPRCRNSEWQVNRVRGQCPEHWAEGLGLRGAPGLESEGVAKVQGQGPWALFRILWVYPLKQILL